MPKTPRARITPVSVNGSLDPAAPHWNGDTAERIVAARRREIAEAPPKRRRGSKSGRKGGKTSRQPRTRLSERERRLRRLERNVKRRKTLAARQRIQKEIDAIRQELGLT